MFGAEFTELVAVYGIWVVAVFIALESIGIPLPAEAALMTAAFCCSRTTHLNIWFLIGTGIVAAIAGDIAGFWIGRLFGDRVLSRYGARLGFTERRMTIGRWLFAGYGGRFVFIARFLPFFRNIGAGLAGINSMTPWRFYFAASLAAAAWVTFYGLAAYKFGEAFGNLASSATIALACVVAVIVLVAPSVFVRCEKRLLAKAELARSAAPLNS